MKKLQRSLCLAGAFAAILLAGCSKTSTATTDVTPEVRASLKRAGLVDVKAAQDPDKGVVTLTGTVGADSDKDHAETLAKAVSAGLVVANQIAVVPPGSESEARKVNEALDKGIESNLEAALVGEKLNQSVKYKVSNHLVTLTGQVETPAIRERAGTIAAGVLNVEQVVNEIQVRHQKATSN